MATPIGPIDIYGKPIPSGASDPWIPDAYEQAVRKQVEIIAASETGQEIFLELDRAKERSKVIPEKDMTGIGAACDGLGTVYFTPSKYVPGSRRYQAPVRGIGYRADEVLIHELIHSMQKLTGQEPPDLPVGIDLPDGEAPKMFPKGLEVYPDTKTGINGEKVKVFEMAIHRKLQFFNSSRQKMESFVSRHDFDSIREFNAILLTNIYISEKNKERFVCPSRETFERDFDYEQCFELRKDHSSKSAPVPLRQPDKFLD
ncbi:MAG: hypothetical protein FJ267_09615, partial [Planctomycetes bacterium]|nr:hypothetical protein [Planctomycetota bacterium]